MLKDKLRLLRKQRNKSQQQIANMLNIAQTTYSKYEVGTAEPNIETLKKIANYYNCDFNYLLSDNDVVCNKNLNEMFNQLNEIERQKVNAYIQGLIDNRLENHNSNN